MNIITRETLTESICGNKVELKDIPQDITMKITKPEKEPFGGELGAVDRSLVGWDEENLLLVSLIECCLGDPDDE